MREIDSLLCEGVAADKRIDVKIIGDTLKVVTQTFQ